MDEEEEDEEEEVEGHGRDKYIHEQVAKYNSYL